MYKCPRASPPTATPMRAVSLTGVLTRVNSVVVTQSQRENASSCGRCGPLGHHLANVGSRGGATVAGAAVAVVN